MRKWSKDFRSSIDVKGSRTSDPISSLLVPECSRTSIGLTRVDFFLFFFTMFIGSGSRTSTCLCFFDLGGGVSVYHNKK